MRAAGSVRKSAFPWGIVLLFLVAGFSFSCCSSVETKALAAPPPGMELTTPEISKEIPGVLRTVNVRLSDGVNPEENAAVWLVYIYGEDAFEENLKDVTLEMLGIKAIPSSSPLFVPMVDYVETLDTVKPEEIPERVGTLGEELLDSLEHEWSAKDRPDLAGYLAANENALAALIEASKCPRYFAPLLAPELPSRLMSASLVIERRLPYLARLLGSRAVMRVKEGDVPGAIADLMAGHRLATLLANGSPFDVSVAKAQVIDSIMFQAERTILGSGLLNAEQLTAFRKEYAAIPPFPPASDAADIGERAIIHQEIELLQSDKETQLGFFEDPEHQAEEDKSQLRSLARSNWKVAIKKADEVQDGIVEALKIKDRQAQLARFAELDQAYETWEKEVDEKTRNFSVEIAKDVLGISGWIGENMAMSLRPNYYQRRASEDRVATRRGLILVGAALEAFQREHQDFPVALTDLVPKYLEAVPDDAATDAPYAYFREGSDRARLVSWGTNRVDDAGQNYNDDVELRLK